MKIALVVTEKPNEVGGARTHYDGLEEEFRRQGHFVDRINIVSDESSIEGILAGYDEARGRDLSSYDAVVSTKAPTYAVRHPRHALHLIHTIRVFYDMFDAETDGTTARQFARDRVRALDFEALSAIPEHRRFSNGIETANRLFDYLGLRATSLHPALGDAELFHEGPFEHFLFVSRLHPWKRPELVVRAYLACNRPSPLVIAGGGPEEQHLRDLGDASGRIRILGHVHRARLRELYSRALTVIFPPVREDFGYVTVEAMLSGKPVITCTDSGEAARIVEGAGCGLVVEPTVEAVAAAMKRLSDTPEEARALGSRGIATAREIRWEKVVRTLLRSLDEEAPVRDRASPPKKTRVLIADNQPIEPPVGGGRLRLWGIYAHLPEDLEPVYVGTYDWPGPGYRAVTHDRLLEITVPQSEEHFHAHEELRRREPALTMDVTFSRLSHLSRAFEDRLGFEARRADVLVMSHPWAFPALARSGDIGSRPLVYDAQNVESLLRRSLLGDAGLAGEIVREVRRLEEDLCERADAIFACSDEDARLFCRLYGVSAEKIHLVPNGVDTARLRPASAEQKRIARESLGLLGNAPVALFIGSNYPPNVEAVRFICTSLAPLAPGVRFLLAGGATMDIDGTRVPPGVNVLGVVSDETRVAAYAAADIALNPMFAGSGTNIKMLDYFAAGLPVITTSIGARGLDAGAGKTFVEAGRTEFPAAVTSLAVDPSRRREMGLAARRLAEECFDWRRIGESAGAVLHGLARTRRGAEGHRQPRPQKDRLRVAILSTWATLCGIADYTAFLADGFPSEVDWRIYAETGSCGEPEGPRVRRNWRMGLEDLSRLESSLREDRPDVLLVQHNPGFFREAGLERLIDLGRTAGVAVAVTLHAARGLRLSPAFAERLGRADRIYVHRASDLGWLEEHGVRGDTRVISHGVVRFPDRSREDARALLGMPESFLIGTFGYVRPHKGILELIEAFDLLASSFPALRLLLLCSEYPGPESAVYRSTCERRISASPHRGRIDACFDHLPLERVGLHLQACDLVVLPYWATRESSSAAVRVAIAARRATLISSSPIFEDLDGCASVSYSCHPHDLAGVIKRLISYPDLREGVEGHVCNFADANSWPLVAARLVSDLRTLGRGSSRLPA